jgi:hypothetical protein
MQLVNGNNKFSKLIKKMIKKNLVQEILSYEINDLGKALDLIDKEHFKSQTSFSIKIDDSNSFLLSKNPWPMKTYKVTIGNKTPNIENTLAGIAGMIIINPAIAKSSNPSCARFTDVFFELNTLRKAKEDTVTNTFEILYRSLEQTKNYCDDLVSAINKDLCPTTKDYQDMLKKHSEELKLSTDKLYTKGLVYLALQSGLNNKNDFSEFMKFLCGRTRGFLNINGRPIECATLSYEIDCFKNAYKIVQKQSCFDQLNRTVI